MASTSRACRASSSRARTASSPRGHVAKKLLEFERDKDLVRNPVPPVCGAAQIGDARLRARAVIHLPREVGIVLAGHVTEHLSAPFEAYRVGVVRVGGLAHESQPIALLQAIPHLAPVV